ncbi:hypothetical protein IFR04_015677 [Cadophora malorum]|uniref:Quercetin 2,3-dioxygenase n=1 Tax=Cadophora malorum TaxID=108018 RepID=A0A8H7T2Q3_9HELO|nr:hypothetical protein IFR04_015677 [Cadophora malorum]
MLSQLCFAGAAFTSLASAAQASNISSMWVDEVPSLVRPYAIQHYSAQGYVVGQQIYRFPVTGPSSDYAFTLISTNAPGSSDLGVFPHQHRTHYENFFNLRGRFQLWTEKDGDEETRILIPGDYGAVPENTTHTFQILDPDTEMVGVISPGGFETLFYALASENYTSPSFSPYDPTIEASPTATPDGAFLQVLEGFDVYVQNYTARSDAVDGAAPAGSAWHTGSNALANDSSTPFFVAKDYGPQYLNNQTGSYKVIQPFVTPVQSAGNFTLSTITMARVAVADVTESVYPGHAAFEVLDGQLKVLMGGETLSLLQGDVVFIPGNTSYKYFSDVAYTKVLHISQGADGLDSALIAGGVSWDSPIWPIA